MTRRPCCARHSRPSSPTKSWPVAMRLSRSWRVARSGTAKRPPMYASTTSASGRPQIQRNCARNSDNLTRKVLSSEVVALPAGRSQTVYTAGEGPPVVWLHGLNGVEADQPIIDQLAKQRKVLAPLAPGFNDLDELQEIRDIHDLALRYDDLLDALSLERCTLLGHSFGAMIAAEIAAHAPRRVEKLVLVSPLGLWNDDYPVTDLFAVPST